MYKKLRDADTEINKLTVKVIKNDMTDLKKDTGNVSKDDAE